jgi:iron complex outermembrane receptor protein
MRPVLLDGIPQTDRVTGDRLAVLGNVPLDIIERVEIMRGPGSALYGADAYSAVVDVITRRIPPDKTQVAASGGSWQTRDARVLGGGRVGDFDVVGAMEYQETDGDRPSIAADLQTNLDALFGTRASLAPGEANTHLRLFGAQLNATGENVALMLRTSLGRDIGMNVGLANALDPFGQVDITTVEGNFTWKLGGRDWGAKLVLDGLFYRSNLQNAHYFPPGAFGFFPDGLITNSDVRQRNTRLQSVVEYTRLPSHRVSVGVGAESGETSQHSESRNYSIVDGGIVPIGTVQPIEDPDLMLFGARSFSHDLQYAYVQDEWTLTADRIWTLTWGVRYDHYSDYGDQLNPRMTLVWDTSPYLTTKLIYGRGFRGPSLVDTSSRQAPALRGNPNLKPETIESIELAFDYRIRPDLLARMNLYYQETDDQIFIASDRGLPAVPMNVGRQIGRGVELEARFDIDRHTQLYAAYSYQDSTDETTSADVGYHPHHLLYARFQRRHKPWLFSIQARYVGRRDRRAEDSRPVADTYTFVDGLVRYELAPDFEVAFDVRNLFDSKAEDAGPGTDAAFPIDIPLPGRTYYFTVTGRF